MAFNNLGFYNLQKKQGMEMEEHKSQVDILKDKIRMRYKGIDPQRINIIPAKPQIENVHADLEEKIVAVYARVSTDDVNQTTSYELQRNHYMDLINRHENWKLYDIYADEGISGTSLNHRDAFVRMIEDCRQGKINLIITKSVSRFARNTIDCLEYVRELKNMPQPVGILFETEGIYTLDSKCEVILTILATFAQEESHTKSDIMNASIDMRFKRGIFLTPPFLGYDVDEDGNLIINKEEAKAVKLIFYMYLAGATCQQIASTLEEYGFKTKKGSTKWSPGSILYILQNERNCGDLLARKTWTPNYLDHKSKKNLNNRMQYRVDGHHEGIVSRDDFLAVQRLISNAKYGNKGFLPELKVIKEGALNGFVIIHPKWSSFTAQDYIDASSSVLISDSYKNTDNEEFAANTGDFDLRKFEVARSQFFETTHKICVTFSHNNIVFNAECIRKYDKVLYVEMLIHPWKKLFAVRPCSEESRRGNQWAKIKRGLYYSRSISCSAFIKILYEIFDWNPAHKYRVRGLKRERDGESLIVFDMTETEVFISQNPQDKKPAMEVFTNGPKKDIKAFPCDWAGTFGSNYYRQAQAKELAILNAESDWNSTDDGVTFNSSEMLNITNAEELHSNIENIKKEQEIIINAE